MVGTRDRNQSVRWVKTMECIREEGSKRIFRERGMWVVEGRWNLA